MRYFLNKIVCKLGPVHSAPSELSDNSSTHGFADFPPSPDSWLGETPHRY